MNKSKIPFFVVVSLFAIALSACGESINSKYGTKYNPEREKLGIPIIPSNWVADPSYAGDWYNPDKNNKKSRRIPVHAAKLVDVQNGVLILEEDIYYGPNDYHDQDGTGRETLYITYCYQADITCHDKVGWGILYESQETFDSITYDKLTLDDAKNVLKGWGLPFP